MKKIILTLAITLVSVCSFAQVKGDKSVGVNLSYGTEIESVGLGVKGQYNITNALRAEASFDYFFEKDYLSMWDINANLHYLFPITNNFRVYPLAGLTYTNWKVSFEEAGIDISSTTGKFGINLGAGAEYDLSDKFYVGVEAKYQLISDLDQMIFGIGLGYKF